MPPFDKWLIGVLPDDPVDSVARQALGTRLRVVSHYLDEAAQRDDSESIHQLRIWTRRAAAAIRLFATTIPKQRRTWIRKTLRKIRRTAGEARDCDVHFARMGAAAQRPPKVLIKTLRKQRREALEALRRLQRRLRKDNRLSERSARLIDSIRWPKRHSSRNPPPFGRWCRQQLASLGEAFFILAEQDLSDDQRLHELRIAGKRLRYALELAGAAIPPPASHELYEELTAVQDRLGELCDHLVAASRMRQWFAESKKMSRARRLSQLLEVEEASLAHSRQRFLDWWSTERRFELAQKWKSEVDDDKTSGDQEEPNVSRATETDSPGNEHVQQHGNEPFG